MTSPSTGSKELLTISPCKSDAGSMKVDKSKAFEVMINPSTYTHGFTIKTNKKEAPTKSNTQPKFSGVGPETVDFAIVIDGTGVVASSDDVSTQVKKLKDVVYTYDGTEHSPNHVQLKWGSFIFYGSLETLSVDYNLFKPSGEPLRVKITLKFIGYMSNEEESRRAGRSSPDLAHIVEVKAGDTLPLLCYRIYKDSSYYAQVAKANDLVNFRSLNPGDRLHFPPLR